ncbi:MAG: endonuclease/exonuclease/phosphatase family protein [Pirellulaceae bacterium]
MKSLICLLLSIVCCFDSIHAQDAPPPSIRFATFNCSLNRKASGELQEALSKLADAEARKVAEIIQRVRPDVLLLNEFDFDEGGLAAAGFKKYLATKLSDAEPIEYAYSFTAPVNTGVDSGLDLNSDGKAKTPDDAFGFGLHPGQYGMLVLSRFPIDEETARTFQKFRWADKPKALWPVNPATNESFYNAEVKAVFRLSSKSHWDVPIKIGDRVVHLLTCHPTPPVFDGAEDRNGRRNYDEIGFWTDYVGGKGDYIYDDRGNKGGLAEGELFVIAGDMNADPKDGESREKAILQLLDHPQIQDPQPKSEGGVEQAKEQGGTNAKHQGDPAFDTGDFADRNVGNLRIDYVLPSKALTVKNAGVFWPVSTDPNFPLVSASDHRLVWVDVAIRK